ncbi:MAG: biotin--[acetyl-CoA-carboxylase] ligase [Clostridia bacterium]|nr:biotin--[acetyl-CoA-carboxylase] ligase [Clostridia bacterium]
MDKAMSNASFEEMITQRLKNSTVKLTVLDKCDSTNRIATEYAHSGAGEFTTVISSYQSAGRGRLERSFFSPENTGLYMSMILRPNLAPSDALKITTLAAVAVAEVIKRHTDKSIGIKWVNDIYANGKKVCGILTTGSLDCSAGALDYAVLGIGINLFMPKDGFPSDIRDTADFVFDTPFDAELKASFTAELINELTDLYPLLGDVSIAKKYRELSIVPGHDIFVLSGENKIPAKALSVGDDYSLSVRFEDGTIKDLSSGDISIRLK